MSLINGHAPDAEDGLVEPATRPHCSGSELSDSNDIPTTTLSPSTAPNDELHSDDDAIHDMATSELDEDEDAPGEDDADFDEETPAAHTAGMDHDRSSSESASRPGKRKAEMDDEGYMMQNPELYGLRRSVRVSRAALYNSD